MQYTSMRHEIPSPRESSLSQHPETPPVTPRRPLSSSFFAPIDPTVPARLWSFALYSQHMFPSTLNKLDSSLEHPYAFSHKEAAFYWTRDDALANRKLNIWAKPPCLNCELAGEDYAIKCDRCTRQEASFGKIQCCTRCEREGDATGCVQQIEIREDGTYGHVATQERSKSGPWSADERDLRKFGLVWWMPINLDRGNIEQKEAMVVQWKQQRHVQLALPTSGIDTGPASSKAWQYAQGARVRAEEKMAVARARNQSLVAEWDEDDLTFIALKAEGKAEAEAEADIDI